ncbi:hypothetical protein [Xanthomonas massiliensis]|jgi:hypothetical protein|uniref:hypothetical protein n=1 Tax=Xanthomonas massiliensis TaxID=1720302 RepID=UPI0011C70CBF|nr:hypothetical protein [Xanthomonas massiliensis]
MSLMTGKTTPKPAQKQAAPAPRQTTGHFGAPGQQRGLTRERIAADLAAFSKAGGEIEVLGNSPLRQTPAKAASPRKRRGEGPATADAEPATAAKE